MQNVFFSEVILQAEKSICASLRISTSILMENAGANSAGFIIKNFPANISKEILIVTGKGNNAGDGFVIARHLINAGYLLKILMLFPDSDLKGDALTNYDLLKNFKTEKLKLVYCKDHKTFRKEISPGEQIVIDAIFGVGFKGHFENRIKDIISTINNLEGKKVIAIDIPSGLNSYTQITDCINANYTLSMGAKKFQTLFYEGRERSGKITVMNIGVSDEDFSRYNLQKIFQVEANDIKKIIPERRINSNKYTNGKVFILAGSTGLTGAAYLCSMAALRAGSGAVVTGVPVSINDIMEVKLTEVMTLPLQETARKTLSLKCYDELKSKLDWADVVLIGPGISKNDETMQLVRKIVAENNLNYVIDADGIAAFKGNLNLLKGKKIILTPHLGEFANLIGKRDSDVKSNFYEIAKKFAKEFGVVLALKNSPTIITNGDEFYINSTGRENLATVGTGDVLTGIIAGIFSQSKNVHFDGRQLLINQTLIRPYPLPAVQSAIAGAHIHGLCGDNLFHKMGPDGLIASDLLSEIANAKRRLREN